MMKSKTDSMKSFQWLAESIHSLLGLKTQLTPTWADSVCNIINTLPSDQEPPLHAYCETDNKDVDLGTVISKIEGELAALTANICQLNIQRRQVLNDFLDLKGNIRVFCRVRPIMMEENVGRLRPVVALDSTGVLLNFTENKGKTYNFDKVFHPGSSQDDVFLEVEPVIKSALDGYNACIFAYGQTGTGKTFTMEGTPDCPGVVPRAIEALFQQAADSNHKFLFSFSMLEIYMGYLKDLLIPQTKKITDPIPPCLSIQTDPKGEIEIDNLVAIQVSDLSQAIRLYRLGCRFRSTASTNSNKASSRSHCMIRILMTCFNATERRRVTNKIWMVDLGGSERMLKTKAWGRRLEEGKAINLSISALGDVINALQRKRRHIPYRNSKLTQVLKDSLGEDSKTLMLVHVSPKEEDLCETVCSLNFATRVKSIHLGNEESTEARVQKEVAMTNLQQKMKQIEDKRNEVRREIKKLNEKLEKITRMPLSSNEQQEASHLPIEVPQFNTQTLQKVGNVTAAPSSEIPRFMRPTICSERKSGTDHEISKDTNLNHTRRRRPSSYSAESVTFPIPIKGMSECNSESTVSRASCLVGLNGKCADNETECSQDTCDCNFKMAALLTQEKSKSSSTHQMAHLTLNEDPGDRNTHKFNSPKFLKVNHWLHLHKNATNISSYTRNKRILAIPTPEKKNKIKEQEVVEKLHDEKVHDYEFRKEKHGHDNIKKLTDAGIAERSVSETVIYVKPTVLKDFTDKDSISNSTCPCPTSDGIIMIQKQDLVNDLSIEGNKCSKFTPPGSWFDKFHQNKDSTGVHEMPMQVITYKRQCSEAFSVHNSLTSNFTASTVDNSIIDQRENLGVSILRSELKARCEKAPIEMGKNSEEEEFHFSAQHSEAGMTRCLYKLRSLRGLPMDKVNQKDLPMPISESLENTQNTGICDLLKEKIQILCTSALIGLGFQSFGFGHDFFYALML